MATKWSFTQVGIRETSKKGGLTEYQELYEQGREAVKKGGLSEYQELYDRACEATREAQRQGDAQLKAAMEAAAAAKCSPVRICPLSLTFSNTGLERAYWQQLSTSIDSKDTIIFALQFLVRLMLLSLLFQTHPDQRTVTNTDVISFLHWSNLVTRLLSFFWIAAMCAAVLVTHLWFSSWFQGNCRGSILLIVAASIWVGEGVTVLASCPMSTHGLVVTLIQCTFMSVLHRVPFCLHLKTRALSFGLQILGALSRVRTNEAVPAILFVSMGHFLGAVLVYLLDQQSRVGFLRSPPRSIIDKILGGSQTLHPQAPKRALGGFAGGFGGVSSLKGSYTPPACAVYSSGHSIFGKDYASGVSCSSPSTADSLMSSWHQ